MTQKFSNNARSRLVGTLAMGATSLTIESPTADLFPIANTSDWNEPQDWFKVTLESASGAVEIIHVGGRNSGSGVLYNLKRGQEGTTALSWAAGSVVGLRITAIDVEHALAGLFHNFQSTGLAELKDVDVGGRTTQNGVEARWVPVNGIILYDGPVSDIPLGWQLCDGTNGTPDLRSRFIIGASHDDAGVAKTNITGALTQEGGSKDAVAVSHSHTASAGNQTANHTHSGSTSTAGGHVHTTPLALNSPVGAYGDLASSSNGGEIPKQTSYAGDHVHAFSTGAESSVHSHLITVNAAGESGENKNLPPYYALAYIKCMAHPSP